MKRWKKITLVLLCVLVLAQAPFVYRRYRLGRLASAVAALNAERVAAQPDDSHEDYAGVFHVHTLIGGHSTGTFRDVVLGAKANRLAFVVMTEHPSGSAKNADATLGSSQDGVVFLNGSELSVAGSGERLFVIPGFSDPSTAESAPDLQTLINRAKGEGRLAFIAYPEQVRDWRLSGYDGVEVYNLYTNSKEINYGLLAGDVLWSYRSYPELLFSTFYQRPDANLKKWDALNASGQGRAVALAGNDAHANVGLGLRDHTGEEFLGVKLDPYERSFRIVRNHVLIEKGQTLSAETLLAALRQGHSYISFDLFCDAGGFRFSAENGAEKKLMGDEVTLAGGLHLSARVPVRSRIVFFRDGQVIHEEREALSKELPVERPGVYRVEVYLERLGSPSGERPWIISNPIYVR
jgi:hypothetical protein